MKKRHVSQTSLEEDSSHLMPSQTFDTFLRKHSRKTSPSHQCPMPKPRQAAAHSHIW